MKRVLKLITISLAVILAGACSKSLKDITITSCDVTSISPRGLSAFDATLDLGVNNPSVQFTLKKMNATVKMDGAPCLYLTADDVTIAPRSENVYTLIVHGTMDQGFNPFSLLTLLQSPGLEPVTVDVSCFGALKSGLGKNFEYKDLPLKDLLGQI
ncbi:MAG: hypothetical protein J6O51_02660 [Bacteroidales bacterium]|nr:hypothetical protein [Bacteroidales bacterium]